jgi:hypothetical protein
MRAKARYIWENIKSVAEDVVQSRVHKDAHNRIWKEDTNLYKACQYILNNYPELTAYITNARLKAANIAAERLLRGEVVFINACGFIKTEKNRVAADISRTIMMTCEAAEVSYNAFRRNLLDTDIEKIRAGPHLYTPYAYAIKMRQVEMESQMQVSSASPDSLQ